MTVQQFNVVDVVRLEIEKDPVGLVNLCQNPSGDLGGWAYVTPLSSSALVAGTLSGVPVLVYQRGVGGASYFTTELLPVAAGQYVAAYYAAGGASDWHRSRFEFYDSAGALLSSSTQSAYTLGGTGVTVNLGPFVAPASTAYIKLRFDIYGSGSGGNPVGANAMRLTDVTVAKAATSGALAGLTLRPPAEFTNVIGSAGAAIDLNQAALDVGALSATIYDTALDPATNTLLRPGRRCRLHYYDGTNWLPLFTGKLQHAKVNYDLQDPTSKRATIEIVATDAVAVLAARSEPRGVATIDELRALLEGKGVPWNCNGSGNQYANAINLRATTDDARVLDQIALTRDTVLGYAWVDRYGVLQAWDAASLSSTPYGTVIDENAYSAIDVEFDIERTINEVAVTVVRTKASGETVEVPQGPYRDQTSIDTWGVFHADYRVVSDGTAVATQAAAVGAAVLAKNATPVIRVNSVTLPIRTTLERTRWCGVGLYQLVEISNTIAGITSMDMRVVGIHHHIEATVWTVTYDLEVVASAAAPRASATSKARYMPETVPLANRNRATTVTVPSATWTDYAPGTSLEGSGVDYSGGTWTITTEGLYLLVAKVCWTGTAGNRRGIRWRVNGATEAEKEAPAPGSADYSQEITYVRRLAVGDTIGLQVWQNTGANLTTTADATQNSMQIARIGD